MTYVYTEPTEEKLRDVLAPAFPGGSLITLRDTAEKLADMLDANPDLLRHYLERND